MYLTTDLDAKTRPTTRRSSGSCIQCSRDGSRDAWQPGQRPPTRARAKFGPPGRRIKPSTGLGARDETSERPDVRLDRRPIRRLSDDHQSPGLPERLQESDEVAVEQRVEVCAGGDVAVLAQLLFDERGQLREVVGGQPFFEK